jgi:hypothetical protein
MWDWTEQASDRYEDVANLCQSNGSSGAQIKRKKRPVVVVGRNGHAL